MNHYGGNRFVQSTIVEGQAARHKCLVDYWVKRNADLAKELHDPLGESRQDSDQGVRDRGEHSEYVPSSVKLSD